MCSYVELVSALFWFHFPVQYLLFDNKKKCVFALWNLDIFDIRRLSYTKHTLAFNHSYHIKIFSHSVRSSMFITICFQVTLSPVSRNCVFLSPLFNIYSSITDRDANKQHFTRKSTVFVDVKCIKLIVTVYGIIDIASYNSTWLPYTSVIISSQKHNFYVCLFCTVFLLLLLLITKVLHNLIRFHSHFSFFPRKNI